MRAGSELLNEATTTFYLPHIEFRINIDKRHISRIRRVKDIRRKTGKKYGCRVLCDDDESDDLLVGLIDSFFEVTTRCEWN